MGKEPDEIQQDIEETRDRLSNTVDALGQKANVPAQLGNTLAEKKNAVAEKASKAFERTKLEYARIADTAREKADHVASVAQRNPLGLLLGASVVGLLVGLILPSSEPKKKTVGDQIEDIKGSLMERGRKFLD